MMVLEQRVPGRVQDFIRKELIGRVGGDPYLWSEHGCGLPKAGREQPHFTDLTQTGSHRTAGREIS